MILNNLACRYSAMPLYMTDIVCIITGIVTKQLTNLVESATAFNKRFVYWAGQGGAFGTTLQMGDVNPAA